MQQLKEKIKPSFYKTQDYLRMDLLYLIKGEFWLVCGRVISLTATFLLALAWGNWIDKNVYGNYQYVLSLVSIVSIFSLPGLGSAVVRAVARKSEGMLTIAFKTRLKWGCLASLAALGIAAYYYFASPDNLPLVIALVIASVFLPFFNAFLIYTSFLTGKKLFKVQVRYEATTHVTAVAAMLGVLFFIKEAAVEIPLHITLPLIITAYFAVRTLLGLLFYKRTRLKHQENRRTDKKTISFGKHLTWSSLFTTAIAGQLDKIILFHYLGAVELAIYSFAILIPDQLKVFLKHISTLALPKLATRSRRDIKNTFLRKVFHLAVLVGAGAAVYIIAAPWIYKFFFGQYVDAASYSRLYAISLIPLSFSVIIGAFISQMRTKEIYQMRILSSLFRIALILTLIPLYGVWGAVLAVIGARTATAIIQLTYFKIRL